MKIAHLTNDIDGRRNSGTARVAREIILSLTKEPELTQTLIHFENGSDLIYENQNFKIISFTFFGANTEFPRKRHLILSTGTQVGSIRFFGLFQVASIL